MKEKYGEGTVKVSISISSVGALALPNRVADRRLVDNVLMESSSTTLIDMWH